MNKAPLNITQCERCQTKVAPTDNFCSYCGASLSKTSLVPYAIEEELGVYLLEEFQKAIEKRIIEESNPKKLQQYIARAKDEKYVRFLQNQLEQLAANLQLLGENAQETAAGQFHIQATFSYLIDYLIIRFCSDLHPIVYNPAILQYFDKDWEEIDFFEMIQHYLDFGNLKTTIYN